MTRPKHTPGPWTLEPYWNGHFVHAASDGEPYPRTIAEMPAPKPSVETVANARLIAAAPDMLEALQAVDEMFSLPGKVNQNTVRAIVRAAISRAEEQPQ